jgi:hypothetical protein
MSANRDKQQFRSYCVEDPAVDLVIDTHSGAVVEAQAVLSGIEGDINKLRVQTAQLLAADNPLFLCALCHVPVYIVSLPDRRRFFFRHRIEDGRCSALTRGPLSEAQINAIKYDGQKEGPDHRRIKEQIRCSLECDPDFSDVQPERYLPGTEPGTWRRPDVSGRYRSLRICFEAQLSTTFLHVMAERRNFYLKEHAALIWVFKEFPRDSIRRLLYDDIFHTNNRNVFIVDERTLAESRQQGRFVMLCLWQRPSLIGDQLHFEWQERPICFDQLTIEPERQRVFFFDCEGAAERLRKVAWDDSWVGEFERYWTTTPPGELRVNVGWQKIRQGRGRREGLWLSRDPDDELSLRGVLNGLYSLREGRPVGWGFPTLIQVVHRSLDVAPDSIGVLARAVEHYRRTPQLLKEDKYGRLASKLRAMAGIKAIGGGMDWNRTAATVETSPYDSLLAQLFPELYRRPPFYLPPSKRGSLSVE